MNKSTRRAYVNVILENSMLINTFSFLSPRLYSLGSLLLEKSLDSTR